MFQFTSQFFDLFEGLVFAVGAKQESQDACCDHHRWSDVVIVEPNTDWAPQHRNHKHHKQHEGSRWSRKYFRGNQVGRRPSWRGKDKKNANEDLSTQQLVDAVINQKENAWTAVYDRGACTCDEQEFSSADDVEKGAYYEGADEADDREREHVEADLILGEVEFGAENVGVLIVDEIEEEGLGEDESEAHNELFCVFGEAFLQQSHNFQGVGAKRSATLIFSSFFFHCSNVFEEDLIFCDCLNNCLDNWTTLLFATFEKQPPRTLGNISAHDNEGSDADPAQKEHSPPMRLVNEKSEDRGHGASKVPRAVDADVDSSSEVGRHELVDSSEDGSELASNAR